MCVGSCEGSDVLEKTVPLFHIGNNSVETPEASDTAFLEKRPWSRRIDFVKQIPFFGTFCCHAGRRAELLRELRPRAAGTSPLINWTHDCSACNNCAATCGWLCAQLPSRPSRAENSKSSLTSKMQHCSLSMHATTGLSNGKPCSLQPCDPLPRKPSVRNAQNI